MVFVHESLEARVSAVAALDEPTRRRLYDFVVREAGPVSRDDAAAALDLPRTTAAFHLDRLVDEGLLDVTYQRLSGRTGPGAGRPSKLYRRSRSQVAVSLPERRYDLAGHLLAAAIEGAEHSGEPVRAVLDAKAHELGEEIGREARASDDLVNERDALLHALETRGFEPRVDGDDLLLANCPFHALAQEHRELMCGMNLALLDGLVSELQGTALSARLDPAPSRCCVRLAAGS